MGPTHRLESGRAGFRVWGWDPTSMNQGCRAGTSGRSRTETQDGVSQGRKTGMPVCFQASHGLALVSSAGLLTQGGHSGRGLVGSHQHYAVGGLGRGEWGCDTVTTRVSADPTKLGMPLCEAGAAFPSPPGLPLGGV